MRRRRFAGSLFVAALLVATAGGVAVAGGILTPEDGHRFAGSAGWLVVESTGPVEVRLDDAPVAVTLDEDPVRHYRLSPLQPNGTVVTVLTREGETRLTLYAGDSGADRFHRAPPEACERCHDWEMGACSSCHRWPARSAHDALLADGCVRCHGDTEDPSPNKVCVACHRGFDRHHPRLRHALSAPRDPLRPGRPFDCVSCHDPHTPASLGGQSREKRRAWCRRCHTR